MTVPTDIDHPFDPPRGATLRATYGANDDRLVEVKRAYDPTNLFRVNQNIAV